MSYETFMGMGTNGTTSQLIRPSRPAPGYVPATPPRTQRTKTERAWSAFQRNLDIINPAQWRGIDGFFAPLIITIAIAPGAVAGYMASRKSGEGKKGALAGALISGAAAMLLNPLTILTTGHPVQAIMSGRTGG